MNVFVTGATGFVGREVLKQLRAGGHSIRLLARPRSKNARAIAARFGAEIHDGDALDVASLARALQNIDAVIHLVGIISELGDQTFENVHTRGTQNLVNAAHAAGDKRFIHMSALGTRANAVSRYHQSKWAAEEILRSSELPWTIFRPSIIYGPDDQFVNLFARMARFSPLLPVMGDGKNKMQPIPVGQVAAAFVRALTEPKSIGQTYDLCGPAPMSFDEILDAILQVTGRKRWKLHIPIPLARMQAAFLEFTCPLVGKPPPLNRDQLLMLQEDNTGDPQPAREFFGLQSIPFSQGIAAYLKK